METIVTIQPTMFPFVKGKSDKYGFTPTYRRAECSKCPVTISWVDTTKNGATDHIVALNLRKRKWHIDEENEQHICAKCQGLPVVKGRRYYYMKTPKTEVPAMFFKSKPKPNVEETPTSDIVTPTPVEVEITAPTPLQLRQIRNLLDDLYDLEGQRYKESYTDATLAFAVGVPEDWVMVERELAYGPAESPESEEEAQVRMLNELVEQARHHAEEANAALQLVEEKVAALKKKLAS
jgi:hypothetical protein